MTPLTRQFRRWRFWRRWLGQRGERAAARFLRKLDYRILAVNISDRRGELDLLALDGDTLVVVEVRSTSHADPQIAAMTVDAAKQRRVSEATLRFLGRKNLLGVRVRFDVLAVAWPDPEKAPTILHLPNAFESTGQFQMFS